MDRKRDSWSETSLAPLTTAAALKKEAARGGESQPKGTQRVAVESVDERRNTFPKNILRNAQILLDKKCNELKMWRKVVESGRRWIEVGQSRRNWASAGQRS